MSVITKEELLRIPKLRKHIARKIQRIELYKAKATGGAIEYKERVQSSVKASASDYLDAAADLAKEISRDVEELHELVGKAATLADSLGDPLERDIIYARYVRGLGWEECVDKLHWSRTWVFQLHGRILQNLKKSGL